MNTIFRLSKHALRNETQQGRILSNSVADGWAGAVMQEPLTIQKFDRQTDRRTYQPIRQSVEIERKKEGKMERRKEGKKESRKVSKGEG